MHGHKTSHLPIRYFLTLLWAHTIFHVSRIRVKQSTRNRTPNLVFCRDDVYLSIHLRLSLETWVQGKLQSESSVAKLRSEWSDGRVTAAAYVLTSAGHSFLVFAGPTQWCCEGQRRCGRTTPSRPALSKEAEANGDKMTIKKEETKKEIKKHTEKYG